MNFGVPKEIKDQEKRVGMTPAGAHALVHEGHKVFVEAHAGVGAGFTDADYLKEGAQIVFTPEEAWGRADVVLKIAPPQAPEYQRLADGQVVMAYLNLVIAPSGLIRVLQDKGITAIAMENIEDAEGNLPVLAPMSEVGGRLAPIIAAQLLQSSYGGLGILITGVPGVPAADVVILGAGVVGQNAARTALGLGAHVSVLDDNVKILKRLDDLFEGRVNTMVANAYNIEKALQYAEVLIGAVLVPGERAPVLVTREMVRKMRKRSVIVDMSIDLGGCVETSRPTTHANPTYVEEGILHYCVPNIPSNVARTATHALTNATIPYLLKIGRMGLGQALLADPGLAKGVDMHSGRVVKEAVCEAHHLKLERLEDHLK
jgi:alanine dehydrogenase